MSSSGLVVNLDRRRQSIGMEEKALSTLEKFVELVEKGGIEEEEEDEEDVSGSTENVLDSFDDGGGDCE
jgi:hypothetical protein